MSARSSSSDKGSRGESGDDDFSDFGSVETTSNRGEDGNNNTGAVSLEQAVGSTRRGDIYRPKRESDTSKHPSPWFSKSKRDPDRISEYEAEKWIRHSCSDRYKVQKRFKDILCSQIEDMVGTPLFVSAGQIILGEPTDETNLYRCGSDCSLLNIQINVQALMRLITWSNDTDLHYYSVTNEFCSAVSRHFLLLYRKVSRVTDILNYIQSFDDVGGALECFKKTLDNDAFNMTTSRLESDEDKRKIKGGEMLYSWQVVRKIRSAISILRVNETIDCIDFDNIHKFRIHHFKHWWYIIRKIREILASNDPKKLIKETDKDVLRFINEEVILNSNVLMKASDNDTDFITFARAMLRSLRDLSVKGAARLYIISRMVRGRYTGSDVAINKSGTASSSSFSEFYRELDANSKVSPEHECLVMSIRDELSMLQSSNEKFAIESAIVRKTREVIAGIDNFLVESTGKGLLGNGSNKGVLIDSMVSSKDSETIGNGLKLLKGLLFEIICITSLGKNFVGERHKLEYTYGKVMEKYGVKPKKGQRIWKRAPDFIQVKKKTVIVIEIAWTSNPEQKMVTHVKDYQDLKKAIDQAGFKLEYTSIVANREMIDDNFSTHDLHKYVAVVSSLFSRLHVVPNLEMVDFVISSKNIYNYRKREKHDTPSFDLTKIMEDVDELGTAQPEGKMKEEVERVIKALEEVRDKSPEECYKFVLEKVKPIIDNSYDEVQAGTSFWRQTSNDLVKEFEKEAKKVREGTIPFNASEDYESILQIPQLLSIDNKHNRRDVIYHKQENKFNCIDRPNISWIPVEFNHNPGNVFVDPVGERTPHHYMESDHIPVINDINDTLQASMKEGTRGNLTMINACKRLLAIANLVRGCPFYRPTPSSLVFICEYHKMKTHCNDLCNTLCNSRIYKDTPILGLLFKEIQTTLTDKFTQYNEFAADLLIVRSTLLLTPSERAEQMIEKRLKYVNGRDWKIYGKKDVDDTEIIFDSLRNDTNVNITSILMKDGYFDAHSVKLEEAGLPGVFNNFNINVINYVGSKEYGSVSILATIFAALYKKSKETHFKSTISVSQWKGFHYMSSGVSSNETDISTKFIVWTKGAMWKSRVVGTLPKQSDNRGETTHYMYLNWAIVDAWHSLFSHACIMLSIFVGYFGLSKMFNKDPDTFDKMNKKFKQLEDIDKLMSHFVFLSVKNNRVEMQFSSGTRYYLMTCLSVLRTFQIAKKVLVPIRSLRLSFMLRKFMESVYYNVNNGKLNRDGLADRKTEIDVMHPFVDVIMTTFPLLVSSMYTVQSLTREITDSLVASNEVNNGHAKTLVDFDRGDNELFGDDLTNVRALTEKVKSSCYDARLVAHLAKYSTSLVNTDLMKPTTGMTDKSVLTLARTTSMITKSNHDFQAQRTLYELHTADVKKSVRALKSLIKVNRQLIDSDVAEKDLYLFFGAEESQHLTSGDEEVLDYSNMSPLEEVKRTHVVEVYKHVKAGLLSGANVQQNEDCSKILEDLIASSNEYIESLGSYVEVDKTGHVETIKSLMEKVYNTSFDRVCTILKKYLEYLPVVNASSLKDFDFPREMKELKESNSLKFEPRFFDPHSGPTLESLDGFSEKELDEIYILSLIENFNMPSQETGIQIMSLQNMCHTLIQLQTPGRNESVLEFLTEYRYVKTRRVKDSIKSKVKRKAIVPKSTKEMALIAICDTIAMLNDRSDIVKMANEYIKESVRFEYSLAIKRQPLGTYRTIYIQNMRTKICNAVANDIAKGMCKAIPNELLHIKDGKKRATDELMTYFNEFKETLVSSKDHGGWGEFLKSINIKITVCVILEHIGGYDEMVGFLIRQGMLQLSKAMEFHSKGYTKYMSAVALEERSEYKILDSFKESALGKAYADALEHGRNYANCNGKFVVGIEHELSGFHGTLMNLSINSILDRYFNELIDQGDNEDDDETNLIIYKDGINTNCVNVVKDHKIVQGYEGRKGHLIIKRLYCQSSDDRLDAEGLKLLTEDGEILQISIMRNLDFFNWYHECSSQISSHTGQNMSPKSVICVNVGELYSHFMNLLGGTYVLEKSALMVKPLGSIGTFDRQNTRASVNQSMLNGGNPLCVVSLYNFFIGVMSSWMRKDENYDQCGTLECLGGFPCMSIAAMIDKAPYNKFIIDSTTCKHDVSMLALSQMANIVNGDSVDMLKTQIWLCNVKLGFDYSFRKPRELMRCARQLRKEKEKFESVDIRFNILGNVVRDLNPSTHQSECKRAYETLSSKGLLRTMESKGPQVMWSVEEKSLKARTIIIPKSAYDLLDVSETFNGCMEDNYKRIVDKTVLDHEQSLQDADVVDDGSGDKVVRLLNSSEVFQILREVKDYEDDAYTKSEIKNLRGNLMTKVILQTEQCRSLHTCNFIDEPFVPKQHPLKAFTRHIPVYDRKGGSCERPEPVILSMIDPDFMIQHYSDELASIDNEDVRNMSLYHGEEVDELRILYNDLNSPITTEIDKLKLKEFNAKVSDLISRTKIPHINNPYITYFSPDEVVSIDEILSNSLYYDLKVGVRYDVVDKFGKLDIDRPDTDYLSDLTCSLFVLPKESRSRYVEWLGDNCSKLLNRIKTSTLTLKECTSLSIIPGYDVIAKRKIKDRIGHSKESIFKRKIGNSIVIECKDGGSFSGILKLHNGNYAYSNELGEKSVSLLNRCLTVDKNTFTMGLKLTPQRGVGVLVTSVVGAFVLSGVVNEGDEVCHVKKVECGFSSDTNVVNLNQRDNIMIVSKEDHDGIACYFKEAGAVETLSEQAIKHGSTNLISYCRLKGKISVQARERLDDFIFTTGVMPKDFDFDPVDVQSKLIYIAKTTLTNKKRSRPAMSALNDGINSVKLPANYNPDDLTMDEMENLKNLDKKLWVFVKNHQLVWNEVLASAVRKFNEYSEQGMSINDSLHKINGEYPKTGIAQEILKLIPYLSSTKTITNLESLQTKVENFNYPLSNRFFPNTKSNDPSVIIGAKQGRVTLCAIKIQNNMVKYLNQVGRAAKFKGVVPNGFKKFSLNLDKMILVICNQHTTMPKSVLLMMTLILDNTRPHPITPTDIVTSNFAVFAAYSDSDELAPLVSQNRNFDAWVNSNHEVVDEYKDIEVDFSKYLRTDEKIRQINEQKEQNVAKLSDELKSYGMFVTERPGSGAILTISDAIKEKDLTLFENRPPTSTRLRQIRDKIKRDGADGDNETTFEESNAMNEYYDNFFEQGD